MPRLGGQTPTVLGALLPLCNDSFCEGRWPALISNTFTGTFLPWYLRPKAQEGRRERETLTGDQEKNGDAGPAAAKPQDSGLGLVVCPHKRPRRTDPPRFTAGAPRSSPVSCGPLSRARLVLKLSTKERKGCQDGTRLPPVSLRRQHFGLLLLRWPPLRPLTGSSTESDPGIRRGPGVTARHGAVTLSPRHLAPIPNPDKDPTCALRPSLPPTAPSAHSSSASPFPMSPPHHPHEMSA